jgi:hypothetical protein
LQEGFLAAIIQKRKEVAAMKNIAVLAVVTVILLGVALPQVGAAGEDPKFLQVFTEALGGSPVTLTPEEAGVASNWPITRVFLVDYGRTYLVLHRTDTTSGRTTKFVYWVAKDEDDGWEWDFRFRVLEGATDQQAIYWVRPSDPVSPGTKNSVGAALEVLIRGYLEYGLGPLGPAAPWVNATVVLIFEQAKPFKRTTIAYPVRVEAMITGTGFVAVVTAPPIADAIAKRLSFREE